MDALGLGNNGILYYTYDEPILNAQLDQKIDLNKEILYYRVSF